MVKQLAKRYLQVTYIGDYQAEVHTNNDCTVLVWEPHLAIAIAQLENIRLRAVHFTCRDYRRVTRVTGLLKLFHFFEKSKLPSRR